MIRAQIVILTENFVITPHAKANVTAARTSGKERKGNDKANVRVIGFLLGASSYFKGKGCLPKIIA